MNEPIEQTVAIAIESYIHAPRVLSVSEVVRQVTSVFPDYDAAAIACWVMNSRQTKVPAELDSGRSASEPKSYKERNRARSRSLVRKILEAGALTSARGRKAKARRPFLEEPPLP